MVALNEDKDHLFIDELEHPSLDLYRKQIQQFMTPLVAAEGPTALASRSVRSKGFRSIVDTEFNRRFPGVTFDVNAYEELDDGEASTTSGAQFENTPGSPQKVQRPIALCRFRSNVFEM